MFRSICHALMLLGAPLQERVLLVADATQPSFERQAVHQSLTAQLLADPTVTLLTPEPLASTILRGHELRKEALDALRLARAHLQHLEPLLAERAGSMALMRLRRVAQLTGDLSSLPEALSITIAALLHLEAHASADRLAESLYTVEPDFQLDSGLFSPNMKDALARVQTRLHRGRKRRVHLSSPEPLAALFVDGKFVDLGEASIDLTCGVEHHVMLQPENGPSSGYFVTIPAHRANSDVRGVPHFEFNVLPALSDDAMATQFTGLIDATRVAEGYVNASDPLLTARHVTQVWVLGYDGSSLRLTAFDLRSGRREQVVTPASLTTLGDVRGAAAQLRGQHSDLQSLAHQKGAAPTQKAM